MNFKYKLSKFTTHIQTRAIFLAKFTVFSCQQNAPVCVRLAFIKNRRAGSILIGEFGSGVSDPKFEHRI